MQGVFLKLFVQSVVSFLIKLGFFVNIVLFMLFKKIERKFFTELTTNSQTKKISTFCSLNFRKIRVLQRLFFQNAKF